MTAVVVLAASCSSTPDASGPRPPEIVPAPQAAPARPAAPGPLAKWERRVGDALENRGVARLERIGARWALTVLCGGTHSTYLDDTSIDVARYAAGYVSARYTWVVRQVDVKCPKAPCPPVEERRIALERLTAVAVTAEQAHVMAKECEGPPDPGPRTED